jgi:hypothetical protein
LSNYYGYWAEMSKWRLGEAVRLVSEYSTVMEGHDTPEGYSVSLKSNTEKCKAYIKNDVESGKFPESIEWIDIDLYDHRYIKYDMDGNEVPEINYFQTIVDKIKFLEWAVSRKFNIPEEFLKLIDVAGSNNEDESELVKAAINAGIVCESYGSKIRRSDLQAKIDKIAKIPVSKQELIWQEVPERYKLGQGESLKSIERAFKAAVHAGINFYSTDSKDPLQSLNKAVKDNKLEGIHTEHFDMILKALKG